MKLRSVFVTGARDIHVPEGWKIDYIEPIKTPKGKHQFQVLLRKEEDKPKKTIGFKTGQGK